MSDKIKVRKRNGRLEDLDIEKIHRVLDWACDGFNKSSVSEIEIGAKLEFYDGITTEEIHNLLIRSANNLISEENPDYQYISSRLLLFWMRKEVWGSDLPPRLLEHIQKNVSRGIYDKYVLEKYTESEIHKIEKFVNHKNDELFTYSGLQQLADKYLCQNRSTKEIFETPQFSYILLSMTIFAEYPEETRLKYVKKCYDYISKFKINLATPCAAGIRTPNRQYSSCILIDVEDSMSGIVSAVSSVAYYTARRAGIGLNAGRIRPINSPIRNGEVISSGVIPYLKIFEATIRSCSQGGIRSGNSTVSFPFWHSEAPDICMLKNNAGTSDNRCRGVDYSCAFSKLFYTRLINDDYITFFSPHEAVGLYDAFGTPEFDALYEKYEKDDSLKIKKRMKARAFAEIFIRERIETGRYYVYNIDNAFNQSPWLEVPTIGNLCQEIIQPLKAQNHIDDADAEIGVCVLSAINILEIKDFTELESVCDIIVRLLESVIDHQDYPVKAAENFAKKRRSLGIGITNLAAYLAYNKIKYEDKEALLVVDEWMEAIQYNLLKASCNLAKEKGKCEKFYLTKYSKGIMPLDRYNKNVDEIMIRKPSFDWDELRSDILKYGLRHSTLTAIMPVESSSVIQNSTSGMDPVRSLLTVKKSKKGNLKQLVPGYNKYKNFYTKAFEMKNNIGIINMTAVLQRWVDMSISSNTFYDYEKFDGKEIPLSVLIKDQLYAYKMGLKTMYYLNTNDNNKGVDFDQDESCPSGACKL